MTQSIFDLPGRFWRGNLHTHSDLSDGVLSPAEVCQRYQDEGYDFLALTDHFVGEYNYPIADTKPFRTDSFTTILGAELHSGAMENGELWHILAVGLPEDFAPSHSPSFHPVAGQETGPELAQRAWDAGAYVAIAHPEWGGMSFGDANSIKAAHAVEVYNHTCGVDCDRANGHYMLDQLLTAGRQLNLCATDDAHFSEPDSFGGWVMVKAAENTPQALLDALKAGHYYSSTGPDFTGIVWEEDRVTVRTSPVKAVIVQGKGSHSFCVHGTDMTDTEVPLERLRGSPWMRITIVDETGHRAWSNPVYR
ncbi:PHP domain-containing protein [Cognatishimia sp.]|uniref:PHP domain-containing protein n=1 Tax=Cognatishimia sp. TaxID=2211648 RepID=UPI0035183508